MAHKRVKSSRFPGVYWRESTDPRRRHNGRPDRCYDYCIREAGKLKWVNVGWVSEGFSEQKAANMRREALEIIAQGGVVGGKDKAVGFSLNDAAEGYFKWMEGEGKHLKPEKCRYDAHVRGILGHFPLASVSAEQVDGLKAELLKKTSPGTAKKALSCCRAIANYAVRTGKWEGVNPFGRERLSMPRPQNKGERFLTPDEARALLDALEKRSTHLRDMAWLSLKTVLRSTHLRDMAWLSLKTGLRSTEIFGLKGGDVDKPGGVLWITEKGGRRTAVGVMPEVLELLAGYGRGAGEYIFPARNGQRKKQISDTFERVCVELNFLPADPQERLNMDRRKKVWFHTLRHTFASWLAQSGEITLHELRDLMRHSSIVMTERYAHLIPGKAQAKTSLIGDILNS